MFKNRNHLFFLNKFKQVCEKHFAASDIERSTSAFDEKMGKILSAPLKHPRLKNTAVPTIFPGCAYYLSCQNSSRDDPTLKKMKIEERQMTSALAISEKSFEQYEKDRSFSNFGELLSTYRKFSYNKLWTVVTKDEALMFLDLENDNGTVTLFYAVTINSDLNLTVSYRGLPIDKLKNIGEFPQKICHMNDIYKILNYIENLKTSSTSSYGSNNSSCNDISNILQVIDVLLNSCKSNMSEQHKFIIDFMVEQLNLINCKPENYRYSTDLLIFSSMFFLISPQAYKFVRESGHFILPHPMTIKKINSKLQLNPQNEITDPNFLSYLKKK